MNRGQASAKKNRPRKSTKKTGVRKLTPKKARAISRMEHFEPPSSRDYEQPDLADHPMFWRV
jgi:hypothetical protein